VATSVPTSACDDTPSPKKDAKDFIEHLRTVHFTLVVICLATIVVISSPSSKDVAKANEQLTQIIAATRMWDSDVFQQKLTEGKAITQCNHLGPLAIHYSSVETLMAGVKTSGWQEDVAGRSTLETPKGDNTRLFVPSPSNLTQFRQLWDFGRTYVCPLSIDKEISYFEVTSSGSATFVRKLPIESINQSSKVPINKATTTLTFELFKSEIFPQGERVGTSGFVYFASFGKGRLLVPATNVKKPEIILSKARLYEILPQYHWRPSAFNTTFRELDRATTGSQDLTLDHLAIILRERESSSKESFEAFGVRFPIEATTHWAMLLIISIQLYFWMHLREFRARNFASSDVAWIGTYNGLTANLVFYLTTVVFPVAVVAYLCLMAGSEVQHIESLALSWIPVAVSSIFAARIAREQFLRTVKSIPQEGVGAEVQQTVNVDQPLRPAQVMALQQLAAAASSSGSSRSPEPSEGTYQQP
jgi:hypothetical protein